MARGIAGWRSGMSVHRLHDLIAMWSPPRKKVWDRHEAKAITRMTRIDTPCLACNRQQLSHGFAKHLTQLDDISGPRKLAVLAAWLCAQ